MLHHIPIVVAPGLSLLCCYCGWVPSSGDESLARHLRREALVGKMTLHLDGARVAHLKVGPGRAYRVFPHPDLDLITWAARSGDWVKVAEMLEDLDESARRDSRG